MRYFIYKYLHNGETMRNIKNSKLRLFAYLLAMMTTQASAQNFNPVTVNDLLTAITTANTNGEADTINLGGQTFNLLVSNNITNGNNGTPSILSDNSHALTIKNGTVRRDDSLSDVPGDNEHFRLFHVASGASLVLDGVTIENGLAAVANQSFGGAIYTLGHLSINKSKFNGNKALADGGAIYTLNGDISQVKDSSFSENSADGNGGAIFQDGGTFTTITHSTFTENSADDEGGALSVESGTLTTIEYSTFDQNSSSSGGAVYITSQEEAVIEKIQNSTFSNNTSSNIGGALSVGRVESIEQNTFSGNTAVFGGAIAVENIPAEEGGFSLSLYNNTFTLNEASTSGGAIYIPSNAAPIDTLVSNIIAQNESPLGPDIFNEAGAIDNESYNLIGNNDASDIDAGAPTDDHSYIGTDDHPIDAKLDELEDNGGPTKTHALHHGSDAIDHGDNPLDFEFDQRGEEHPRVRGEQVDIGSFEAKKRHHDHEDDVEDVVPVIGPVPAPIPPFAPPLGGPIDGTMPGAIAPPVDIGSPAPSGDPRPEVVVRKKPNQANNDADKSIAKTTVDKDEDKDGGCTNSPQEVSMLTLLVSVLARRLRRK